MAISYGVSAHGASNPKPESEIAVHQVAHEIVGTKILKSMQMIEINSDNNTSGL